MSEGFWLAGKDAEVSVDEFKLEGVKLFEITARFEMPHVEIPEMPVRWSVGVNITHVDPSWSRMVWEFLTDHRLWEARSRLERSHPWTLPWRWALWDVMVEEARSAWREFSRPT